MVRRVIACVFASLLVIPSAACQRGASAPTEGAPAADGAASTSAARPIQWWTSSDTLGLKAGDEAAVLCPARDPNVVVTLYGSGPYTADSAICEAATHAGRITPAGGEVVVVGGGPHPEFKGSRANGVLAMGWSAYPRTFTLR